MAGRGNDSVMWWIGYCNRGLAYAVALVLVAGLALVRYLILQEQGEAENK